MTRGPQPANGPGTAGFAGPCIIGAMKIAVFAALIFASAVPANAQVQPPACFFLCRPELKIEPTVTWDNLLRKPKVAETDAQGNRVVTKTARERIFETVIAADIPTTVPRIGFTFETVIRPFVKGASPELETEFNFHWLRSEDTGGWVGSHFDIVDKYSPGERPDAVDRYTHKLNFELDTAVAFLKWTRKPWLGDIEIEGSLDYLRTGLARAGDRFGNVTYLDNASRWSFSLVFVVPVAPLR
jgi:hypothetical protein